MLRCLCFSRPLFGSFPFLVTLSFYLYVILSQALIMSCPFAVGCVLVKATWIGHWAKLKLWRQLGKLASDNLGLAAQISVLQTLVAAFCCGASPVSLVYGGLKMSKCESEDVPVYTMCTVCYYPKLLVTCGNRSYLEWVLHAMIDHIWLFREHGCHVTTLL